MKKKILKWLPMLMLALFLVPVLPAKAWVADNGDGTFTNPVMWGDYPDNDIIRVGDTYYMSSTSMHLFPACPIMSSKDLVNWKYESYALSEEDALALAKNDDGLTLKDGWNVYDKGPWATSLRYSEKLKKFYLLVNMQDGVDSEYAILCVADQASGPWKAYRLDNPEGAIKGLYDPGLLFDKDPVTGEENGDIWVVHGQGSLYVTKLKIVDEKTGELAIDETQKNLPFYNYTGGGFNEGSHAYKFGDTYYVISTPTWSGTSTKKSIAIQTKDLLNGPYEVKDIMRSYMNFGENGIHQGGIVDVPQEDGSSEWWSVIFQDRGKLGRVPTLQPVYWETDEKGLDWPMMGVKGQNGDQAVVTMKKPNTGATTKPSKVADSDEFDNEKLGLHWQWNHVSNPEKWSLTERPGYMRLHTASVTNSLTNAQNTLRQRVVGPESDATIKLDISKMQDGDIAGLSVIQREYNYIGVKMDGKEKRVLIDDKGSEQCSETIPADTKEIWFRASMPRYEYRTEFSYSLDGKNFVQLGGKYDMHYGNYVGMGFGAFNYATKELGGYVDLDYFHVDTPDDHGNYNTLNQKIEAERYDLQSYDSTLGEPSRNYNPLTLWTADYTYTDEYSKSGKTYDLALGNLRDGNWVEFNRVDFKEGAKWLNFRVSGTADGGKIEVRLGDAKGDLLATIDVPNTGDLEAYQNVIVPLEKSPKDLQKICLVYQEGAELSCQINWWMVGDGKQPSAPEAPKNFKAKSLGESRIEFSWDEVEGAKEYDLKLGDEIISNVTSPWVKTNVPEGAIYKASVRSKNDAGYSAWSEGVKVSTEGNPYRIPQSGMSIAAFSSEEAGGEGPKSGYAAAILDGDANTFWHTKWSGGNAEPPHWFIVDLGKSYNVNKITLLPRQGSGNTPNGLIKKMTLSYSNTGIEEADFTTIVEEKELSGGVTKKSVEFEPVTARYLKVFVNEGHNNFATLAEMEVFRTEADETQPEAPKNVEAKVVWSDEKPVVELNWEAAADLDSGISCYSIFRDGKFLDVTSGLKYTDKSVELNGNYQYEIVATNGAGLDGEAAIVDVTVNEPPKSTKIPQENMTAMASSEEQNAEEKTGYGYAKNALDGNPETFWCTKWDGGSAPAPHWIQIDLGKVYMLDRAEFLQRDLSKPFGQVTSYNLSYSEDGEQFTMLVEGGVWDLKEQSNTVDLGKIKARYLKLDCLEAASDFVHGAMAEINVYEAEKSVDSISVSEMPSKVSYTNGEVFDPSGLVLKLSYNDGSEEEVKYGEETAESFAFDPSLDTPLEVGNQVITVTYKEMQVTIPIVVEEKVSDVPDKSKLEQLIQQAEAVDRSKYTEESLGVLDQALNEAKAVQADETLTGKDQQIVDDAAKALEDAIIALQPIDPENPGGGDEGDGGEPSVPGEGDGEKPSVPDAGNGTGGNTSDPSDLNKAPKTGDETPVLPLVLVLLGAGAAVEVCRRKLIK